MGVGAAAAPVATPAPRGTTATGELYQHLDYRVIPQVQPSRHQLLHQLELEVEPLDRPFCSGDGTEVVRPISPNPVRAENVTRSWLEEYNLGSLRLQGIAYRTIPEQYLANSYPLN